ncbi:MAG TPA: tripartite tricarboxylate transporter substrate binding protein [Xanthobacteraceae bacterium]|jgi:tripartite-type tricarboxylate transporter receptor subunit TctC
MPIIGRRSFLTSAGGFVLAGGILPAVAETQWPTRPVRFIVPLAAGGALDFAARQCTGVLSRDLGQQVFVENRTGAGGTIGMDLAMKAAPDGYTFLVTNDNAAIAPHILHLPYDYTKELLPVIMITRQPIAFAVHPSLGVKSVAELVAYAKQNPGLGFASSGVGSNQHILGAWFAREAGIKLDHVPYRGAGQAVTDLLAGHVKFGILGPAALMAHARAGTIILIAQTSERRAAALLDVPTLVEAGYKDMILESWFGLFAPEGTPGELIKALNSAAATALGDVTLRENFTAASLEATGGTPEQLGMLARADSEKYAQLVKELNITAE